MKENPAKAQEIYLQAVNLSHRNMKDAIDACKLAYAVSLDANDHATKLKSLILMGRCASMSGHTSDAIKWLLECISTAEMLNMPEEMSEAYNQLGNTYSIMKDFPKAVNCYLNSLEILKDNKLESRSASVLNNIGSLLYDIEEYDQAIEYFQKSYEKDLALGETSEILLTNLARIFAIKKDFQKARFYLERAKECLIGAENQLHLSWIQLAEGELAQACGDIGTAVDYYKIAVDMLRQNGDAFSECEFSLMIGKLLLDGNKAEEALKVLHDGYCTCTRLELNDTLKRMADLLARSYMMLKDEKHALEYYVLYSEFAEKAQRESNEKQRKNIFLQMQQHETNLERLRLKRLSEELLRTTDELRQAYATLERQAVIDSLTGIRNRRSMDLMLDSAWKRCQEEGIPFTLMLVDLDCFKKYNDYYGHPAGDMNIRNVAACLSDALQDEKLVGRYGGDEFVAVLPGFTQEQAYEMAESMRTKVRQKAIRHDYNDNSEIQTITIGVVCLVPGKADTASEALHLADEALYEGKRSGKDKVVIKRMEQRC